MPVKLVGAAVAAAVLAVWLWPDRDGEHKAGRDDSDSFDAPDSESASGANRLPDLGALSSFDVGDPVDEAGNPILIEVSGTAVDVATGEAVADAEVMFQPKGRRGVWSATTDADGSYRLKLAPGFYKVVATGEGRYGLAGAALALARNLKTAQYEVGLVGLANLKGVVVDGEGQGIRGARVTFRSEFQGGRYTSKSVAQFAPSEMAAETGNDGNFVLDVIPGRIVLTAQTGPATARLRVDSVAPGSRHDDLRVVLDASGSVAGRVVSAAGSPVEAAEVALTIVDALKERTTRTVAADKGGHFVFDSITPGQMRLEAHAEGLGGSEVMVRSLKSGESVEVTLSLGEASIIRGTVVDGEGRPVEGVQVACYRWRAGTPAAEAETTHDGAFECAGLGSGRHSVRAQKRGHGRIANNNVVAPVLDLRLELTAPGSLRGVVKDSSGSPVQSFAVRLLQVTSDFDGVTRRLPGAGQRFVHDGGEFDLPIPSPGRYHVAVTATGHGESPVQVVQVPSNGVARAEFVVEATGEIRGHVVDSSGANVDGAEVQILSGYGGKPVFTDSGGRFVVAAVSVGRRSLRVSHSGMVSVGQEVEVRSGKATEVALELRRTSGEDTGLIEYAGIGALLDYEAGKLRIHSLVRRSSASRRLRRGDEIVEINGRPAAEMSVAAVVETIRGRTGTLIRLSIKRGDLEFDITLGRMPVSVRDQTRWLLVMGGICGERRPTAAPEVRSGPSESCRRVG